MSILRIITDIQLQEQPDPHQVEKIQTQMRDFAFGTVSVTTLTGNEGATHRGAHVHVSTPGLSCSTCRLHAVDELS